jgi:hypothetical protein
MDYDKDKVDKTALALMYLTSFNDYGGVRSWKGYDWDILNRLHEKGFIDNPVGKAKSVILTEEGVMLSEELFKEYFGK